MKRAIGWLAHAACLAAVLLSIWTPVGGRGQWIATAVVLLVLGAALLGSPSSEADRYGETRPTPLREGEILASTGNENLDRAMNTRPQYGKKAK